MIMKNTTPLGNIICLVTLFIKFTDAALESHPLETRYTPVLLRIGYYVPVPENENATETKAADFSDSTEIFGWGPDDDDDRVIFVETIDPEKEPVMVDESAEMMDPATLSEVATESDAEPDAEPDAESDAEPATEPDSSPPAVSSPDTVIRDEVDSENTPISEASEESPSISELDNLDEIIAPDEVNSEDPSVGEAGEESLTVSEPDNIDEKTVPDEVDSEIPSVGEAGEESLPISEPEDLDQTMVPETNESDDSNTNESAPTVPKQKPVFGVEKTELLMRPSSPVPNSPGNREISVAPLHIPFNRRRDPNRGEVVLYVRVILGYVAFETPLDIWLASAARGPPHEKTECYFTMVPIEEMPELFHYGTPSRDDITSGRTTKKFTLSDWSLSVKNATGVGCTSWVPREKKKKSKGWWSRRRSP